jgi:hypothetical protein
VAVYFREEAASLRTRIRQAAEELRHTEGQLRKALAQPKPRPDAPERTTPDEKQPAAVPPEKEAELMARIQALEDEIAEKDRAMAERRSRRRPRREEGDRTQSPAQRMAQFMKDLKERDPERYAQMQERFRAMGERMQTGMGKQQEFFDQLNPELMSDVQAESHDLLMGLLARNQELLDAINEDPEAEDVPELRQELRENMREASQLLETERETALQNMARELGYEGEQIQQFEDYVNHIFDMTSNRTLWGGWGRGGPTRGSTGGGRSRRTGQ